METPEDKYILYSVTVLLFVFLIIQMFWIYRPNPAAEITEAVPKELAAAALGTLNLFVKTDQVARLAKELKVLQ